MRWREANITDDVHGHAPAARTEDPRRAVEAWLAVFVRLLPMRQRVRQEIRDELHAHLTERMRDLMLGGLDESEALRQATGELGDLAQLAREYRRAHQSNFRRPLMYMLATGMTVSLVLIAASLHSPVRPAAESMDTGAVVNGETNEAFAFEAVSEQRITVSFEELTIDEAAAQLGAKIGRDIVVHRAALEREGIDFEKRAISLALSNQSVERVLEMLLSRIDATGELSWRFCADVVELGTHAFFDRRERHIRTYDLSETFAVLDRQYGLSYDERIEQVSGLLLMVSPDSWHDMGGVSANMHFVGGKVFVSAPHRIQSEVERLLQELAAERQHAVDTPLPGTPASKSMHRLLELGRAVITAAHHAGGVLPEAFAALAADGVIEHSMLESPFGPVAAGESDYVLLHGGRRWADIDAPDRIMLAYDRAMRLAHPHTAVLFADGRVELLESDRVIRLTEAR